MTDDQDDETNRTELPRGQSRESLRFKVERAKANARGRGYAVTFTGPAAEASVHGSVDGYHGRPNRPASYPTRAEQEAYDYSWDDYYRPPRDRHGYRYEQGLC